MLTVISIIYLILLCASCVGIWFLDISMLEKIPAGITLLVLLFWFCNRIRKK